MAVNLSSQKLPLPRGVCGFITEYLELSPGVAASNKKMELLLDHVRLVKNVRLSAGLPPSRAEASASTDMTYERRKKQDRLMVRVNPALRTMEDYLSQRPVYERRYDATRAGMLAALVDSKAVLVGLKRGRSEPSPERSCTRMKYAESPPCCECMLSAALGCGACLQAK